MATGALKQCSFHGCRVLVRGAGSRCKQHLPKPFVKKNAGTKRTTGRKLQRWRDELFSRNPLCALCETKGLSVPAVVRDHIKPLFEDGADSDENTQGLCHACHDEKSAAESARASAAARRGKGWGG